MDKFRVSLDNCFQLVLQLPFQMCVSFRTTRWKSYCLFHLNGNNAHISVYTGGSHLGLLSWPFIRVLLCQSVEAHNRAPSQVRCFVLRYDQSVHSMFHYFVLDVLLCVKYITVSHQIDTNGKRKFVPPFPLHLLPQVLGVQSPITSTLEYMKSYTTYMHTLSAHMHMHLPFRMQ